MDKIVVLTFQESKYLCLLQNSIYDHWAWKYSSTLGRGTINFSPTDCFETFPFPQNLHNEQIQMLEQIGAQYYEHRRQLMLAMQLGLTKTYNAFHAPEIKEGITTQRLNALEHAAIEKQYGREVWNLWAHLKKTPNTCSIEDAIDGIVKLRGLHVQMDYALLDGYGWASSHNLVSSEAIELNNDFYEVDYLPENDRIRFTIHPEARKEILNRLQQLNHQLYKREKLDSEIKPSNKKNKPNKTTENFLF